MAELDPNIILSGTATTHPVTQIPLGNLLQQGAETARTQAEIPLVRAQAQGVDLQNQVAQMNLQNAKFMGQAQLQLMNQLRAKAAQGYSDPVGGASAPADQAGSIAPGMPGAVGNPDQGPAPASAGQPGMIDPSAPPAPQGVSPYAWEYAQKHGYTIDQAHDWYQDKDGNPLSHYAGPELTPGGRPNMMSQDVQYQLGDILQKMGAPPQFVAGLINDGMTKAQSFDKQNAEIYKDMATAADAKAKMQDTNQQIQMRIQGFMANSADAILNSPHPAVSLLQDIGTHPGLWNDKLKAAGLDPNKFDPSDPQQIEVAKKMLSGMQQQSPIFLERTKTGADVKEKLAQAAAAGIHEVHGVDPETMLPTTKVIQTDANGTRVIFQGSADGAGAAIENAQAQAIAEYRAPPIENPRTPIQIALEHKSLTLNPNLSVPAYKAYQAGIKEFAAGGVNSPAKTLQSFNTVADHLNLLQQLNEAYKRTDNQQINAIQAKLSAAFGGTAVTNLQAAAQLVGAEIPKSIIGGQTALADREHQTGLFDPKLSSKQVDEILGVIRPAVGGQLEGLHQRWLNIMPDDAPQYMKDKHEAAFAKKLTPAAQAAFASHQAGAAGSQGSAAPAVGTIVKGHVYMGGDPSQQSSWKPQ